MRNNSNWTGRAPRTINEAFGPYESYYPTVTQKSILPYLAGLLIFAGIAVIGANMIGLMK